MPAEATQKSRIKAKVKQEIEKTLPDATPEEKEAYMIRRFKEEWDKYTPGRPGRHASSSDQMETGRTRSRLEIRMGYEQKPCNPAQVLSEEIVSYVGPKTSVPYRLEPTIEYPDDMSVQSDQKEILDSADDPEYQQEMQLWRAYRDAYEEKARKNENKLRERITSLEQQLVQLQDKYLPSTWSCEDPYVAKIEEQNKKIDEQTKLIYELKTEIGQLYKQIKEQERTIYHLNKNPLLQLKNVEFDPPRMLAIEPLQAESRHHA
jgi:hypothetical protein